MNRIDGQASNSISLRPQVNPLTPVSAAEGARQVSNQTRASGEAGPTSALSAGDSAPVNQDRVTAIRKAIDQGHYPVVPARIADAMIAAGYLLRNGQ